MKRILLLTTLAAMMAAAMALSGVAQAKPITEDKADKKCLMEAVRTVEQPGFNPSDYTFVGGTDGPDPLSGTVGQPDVFCGFGGDDPIAVLDADDIFLGGEGIDTVTTNRGTVYGGAGDDVVTENEGTFNGGAGDDSVRFNEGTFNGGEGIDKVDDNQGTFNGGAGDDSVNSNSGIFDGGEGNDFVGQNNGSITINVEQGDV